MIPFVCQEIRTRGHQERPKLAFTPIDNVEHVLFQKAREKPLSQVLCLIPRIALPSYKGVERVPIDSTKFCKGLLCGRRVPTPAGDDHAPVSGRKPVNGWGSSVAGLYHRGILRVARQAHGGFW